MIEFLRNNRGHANPISIALNIATVLVGVVIILFDPKFLPIKGIAFFAAFLLIVQMIHIMAFGTNPLSTILATVVIILSAVVLKLGLGGPNFVTSNAKIIIISLLGAYLLREIID